MDKLFHVFLFAPFVVNILSITAENSQLQTNVDNSSLYRIPKDIFPEFYNIFLLTNVTRGDFHYDGIVKIDLRVIKNTNRIVLHTDKLLVKYEKSVLKRILGAENFEDVKIIGQNYNENTHFYTITTSENLVPGRYWLTLHFVGEVLDDSFGFYRSSYKVNNKIRWIGVTQFSSIFARRAFPCMDEPAFKAIFQLSIGHYGNEIVSSNTFPESRIITNRTNYYITKFSPTPRMSTYLLGWAIHDFARVNSTNENFWLWTRHEDHRSLAQSPMLTEGPKIFNVLETYTGIKNPVSKIEHFAVPDFYFSAMENWGFITFRESVPLVWYKSTPLTKIHKNLVTQGHEYSHTWFGNIITPAFWDIMWLKEGFATYFAYLCIDKIHGDWRMMNLFTLEVMQNSLLQDSVNHNRTMNGINIGSPNSAKKAMDFVTYDKGASVLRMIADILGEELFQKAIRSYLQEKQYEPVTPPDFYKHVEIVLNSSAQSINMPVRIVEFIESWTTQPNFPLVKIHQLGRKQLKITQERFEFDRSKINANDSKFWWIPLTLVVQSGSNHQKMLEMKTWLGSNKSKTIDLPMVTTEDCSIIANLNLSGYYRVNYDESNWRALKKLLNSNNFQKISSINRAGLLDDAFNLARADFENYALPMDLAKYLKRETEYEPWVTACRAFRLLDNKLKDKPHVRAAFRNYVTDLITPIYEKLSFDELATDSHIKKIHRDLILTTACSLNLRDCILNAKLIFDNWIVNENKPVPANLKSTVYRTGIVNGTDDDWMKLWKKFLKSDIHSEREIMYNGLANTENSSFINMYLDFSINAESYLARQYRLSMIESLLAGSSKSIEITLNYIHDNFDKVVHIKGITYSSTFLESLLSTIAKEITSEVQYKQLSEFVNRNEERLENALKTGKKAIETAKDTIASISRYTLQISRFLNC